MVRHVCLVSVSVWFLLSMNSCSPAVTEKPKSPLRLSLLVWPGYFPALIADERGLFKKRGIDMKIDIHDDMAYGLSEFAAGTYDLTAVPLGDIIPHANIDPKLRIILCPDVSAGGDALVGQGPKPTDAAKVKGLRVGTTLLGFGEVFVREWVKKIGLAPDDIILVHVEAAEVMRSLKSGTIDVGHTWSPYLEQAISAGAQVWFDSSETPGLISDVVAVRSEVLRERRADIESFVDAWFEAEEWWRANPDEGSRLLCNRLKIPPEQVTLTGVKLIDRAGNRAAFLPGGDLRLAVDRYTDFFIARGAIGKNIDRAALLDGSLVE
jgi:NitT/TauT family transport system substrate-binding protein